MVRSPTRSHVLILPLVILLIVLLEELAEYQMRRHIADPYVRTATTMLLYGIGFSLVAANLGPGLKKILVRVRSGHRKRAGRLGVWLFFALAYGLLFYAYFLLETKGPATLFSSGSL